jgi:FAD-linked oxidoreductase
MMGRKPHWTRRNILGAGGALSAALMLSPLKVAAAEQAAQKRQINWRNWGGNLHSQPGQIAAPRSEEEVVDLLRSSRGGIRPVGSGHSWSGLVPTDDTMVTLDRLKGLISHDANTMQAEVWAGTKLFAYGPMMEEVGQAILNMSDIDYQSMAGAVSTSTHGTGVELGSISSFVVGLQLVSPSGEVLECNADNNTDLFYAACSGLGSLGIITRLRFQNREKHRLHQETWLTDMEPVLEDIQNLATNNQQFELFPLPHSGKTIVVITNAADAAAQDHIENDPNALNQLNQLYNVTEKIPGINEFLYDSALAFAFDYREHRIGPSYQVLAHPRTIRFMEMEYTVPAETGVACLREVLATIEDKAPEVMFPLEFRYVKADDTMIGMFSGQDGCSISVHQFADNPNWRDYFSLVEPVFKKFGGRPHWGKWHSRNDADFSGLYPNWDQFKTIRREIDPGGRMLNGHLRTVFGEA